MGQRLPAVRFSGTCAAPLAVVYDLLADLRSHLRWRGTAQSSDYRLLSMEAPDAPAKVGTIFTTTGAIPMSVERWEDRSTVTLAARPATFEFVTEGRVGNGPKAMRARYVSRYEIT